MTKYKPKSKNWILDSVDEETKDKNKFLINLWTLATVYAQNEPIAFYTSHFKQIFTRLHQQNLQIR